MPIASCMSGRTLGRAHGGSGGESGGCWRNTLATLRCAKFKPSCIRHGIVTAGRSTGHQTRSWVRLTFCQPARMPNRLRSTWLSTSSRGSSSVLRNGRTKVSSATLILGSDFGWSTGGGHGARFMLSSRGPSSGSFVFGGLGGKQRKNGLQTARAHLICCVR